MSWIWVIIIPLVLTFLFGNKVANKVEDKHMRKHKERQRQSSEGF